MSKHKTIKDHQPLERPVEKCLHLGAEALSDAELLSIIIRTGSKDETAVELAERVLSIPGMYQGLASLHHLTIPELSSLDGIGSVKAVQLKCLSEISRRMSKEAGTRNLKMNSPAAIANYFMEDMRHKEREELRVVFFDTKAQYICDIVLFQGTVNSSLVSPREIFMEALRYQAVFICVLHNHPSGNVNPSEEDIRITHRIKEAGEMLNIRLIDHIIIAGRNYFSFKEQRIL